MIPPEDDSHLYRQQERYAFMFKMKEQRPTYRQTWWLPMSTTFRLPTCGMMMQLRTSWPFRAKFETWRRWLGPFISRVT
jgi:hypothetical protein